MLDLRDRVRLSPYPQHVAVADLLWRRRDPEPWSGRVWHGTFGPSVWHHKKRNAAPLTIRSVAPLCNATTRGRSAMPDSTGPATQTFPRKRADARRNEQALLDAAAAVFVASGVDAPVRDIAAAAGVGMGTIYRHFPTRADLVIAVYRHQVDACAEAGPALLASSSTPHAALTRWIDLFVDFLVTKHGLAAALQSDKARFETLHAYFLDRLVPVCAELLDAAAAAGEIRPDVDAYELMRG